MRCHTERIPEGPHGASSMTLSVDDTFAVAIFDLTLDWLECKVVGDNSVIDLDLFDQIDDRCPSRRTAVGADRDRSDTGGCVIPVGSLDPPPSIATSSILPQLRLANRREQAPRHLGLTES